MMGERTVAQEALFYEFSLERHVPAGHLLRSIDQFVDLSGIREHLRPYYSETGRPSIDPELMIRMLIVGYSSGSARSAGCARRFTSTWHIAGSAAWGWKATSRTTRPFRRTVTAAFATAICCAASSRQRCSAALPKDWLAVTALPSMRA